MSKHYQPPATLYNRYSPTAPGQSLVDTILLTILTLFIYHVIVGAFRVLFWPVRYLVMSDNDIYDEEKRKAKQKIIDREKMLKEAHERIGSPVEDPRYAEWYKLWREGKALDSKLLFAPDVYKYINPIARIFNTSFLNYLEIQVKLHETAGWSNRALFKRTLWRYYPEFSTRPEEIPAEIEAIRERLEVRALKDSLGAELTSIGLSSQGVDRLMSGRLEPERMKAKVETIKKCKELRYCEAAAVTIDEMGFKPESEEGRKVNEMLSHSPVPAYVTIALLKGEIDEQSYAYLVKSIESSIERNGLDNDTHRLMLMLLDEERKICRPRMGRAMMRKQYGKPVWEA